MSGCRYVRGEACVSMGFSLQSGEGGGNAPQTAVLGSAINQDGRSSSLTAPNGPSQQQVSHHACFIQPVICLDLGCGFQGEGSEV